MTLAVSTARGVTWITIDAPPMNLFTRELVAELSALADRTAADDAVRVVVFQSANPDFFVAHFDIHDVYRSVEAAPQDVRELNFFQLMIERWRRSAKLSIAKISGLSRGAGTEFILGLDMCYAHEERAIFSLPEIYFGFPPGGGSCQYLARKAGYGRALEFVLSGDDYDARAAERLGLITRALPGSELDAYVANLAERIGALPLPSVIATKRIVGATEVPLEQALREGNAYWTAIVRSPALQQTIERKTAAFLAAGGQSPAGEKNYAEIRRAMRAA